MAKFQPRAQAEGNDDGLKEKMIADYASYVKRNGVVEVPPGYDVIKQAMANAAKKD